MPFCIDDDALGNWGFVILLYQKRLSRHYKAQLFVYSLVLDIDTVVNWVVIKKGKIKI